MRGLMLLLVPAAVFAQGTNPKAKPEDYEAHGEAKYAALGAEFTVHSFSGHDAMYIAPDYLVVEVALYPPKGGVLTLDNGAFSLRVNGKKPIMPAPITMVQASLQHVEWRTPPRLQAGIGGPGGTIGTGTPAPQQGPYPPASGQPVPGSDIDKFGVPRTPGVKAADLAVQIALPEGQFHAPVSGFLFFPYQDKVKKIKSLELLFEDAEVKLK